MIHRHPRWTKGQCLVYGRVSKETQDAGLADQYEVIQQLMREADLAPIREPFEDDGGRGHDEDRPGLREVIEYVKAHSLKPRRNEDFVPILVYNVARFGRFDDSKKIFRYLVEIEEHGYEFYSVMEGLRSRGDIGQFVQLIIRGEQAYQYTLDLSEYGIRTGCSLAEKGWWPGGLAPFGYDRMTYGPDGKPRYRYVSMADKSVEKYTPKGKLVEVLQPVMDRGRLRSPNSDKLKTDKVRLVPNPERARIVRDIFRWYVREDLGIKRIADRLNVAGVPSPRNRHWIKTAVREILRNHAYRGALVYGRRSDGKHHDVEFQKMGDRYVPRMRRRDVAAREFVHRTLEECVVFENCHPRIIDAELWDQARAKMARRPGGDRILRGNGARGSTYILSGDGLMKCVLCGYRYHGSTERRTKIRYYLDGGWHGGGNQVCRMTLVRADRLEEFVLGKIRERITFGLGGLFGTRESLVERIEQTLGRGGEEVRPADPRAETLERKLGELRKKRQEAERLASEFGDQGSVLVARIRKEEEALARELGQLPPAPRPRMAPRDRGRLAREIARACGDMEKVLAKGTVEEKRRLVRSFVQSIEVDGDKRTVKVTLYDDVRKSPLMLVPPTGVEPVSPA